MPTPNPPHTRAWARPPYPGTVRARVTTVLLVLAAIALPAVMAAAVFYASDEAVGDTPGVLTPQFGSATRPATVQPAATVKKVRRHRRHRTGSGTGGGSSPGGATSAAGGATAGGSGGGTGGSDGGGSGSDGGSGSSGHGSSGGSGSDGGGSGSSGSGGGSGSSGGGVSSGGGGDGGGDS